MFPHPTPPSNERFHEGRVSGLLPVGAPGSPPVLSAEISHPGPKLEAEVLGVRSGEENISFWGMLAGSHAGGQQRREKTGPMETRAAWPGFGAVMLALCLEGDPSPAEWREACGPCS